MRNFDHRAIIYFKRFRVTGPSYPFTGERDRMVSWVPPRFQWNATRGHDRP